MINLFATESRIYNMSSKFELNWSFGDKIQRFCQILFSKLNVLQINSSNYERTDSSVKKKCRQKMEYLEILAQSKFYSKSY